MLGNSSPWKHSMEKTKYIFIGAGGHARVLASVIESNQDELVAVFDTNLEKLSLDGVKNEGEYKHDKHPNAEIIIAIGDNVIRERISQEIKHTVGQAIHRLAVVDRLVNLAEGVQIIQGAIVNRGASIGKHTIVNTNATVDHDCKIGDFVHIAPGATLCGGVKVGKRTLIGANATVLPNCEIGANVNVGAGAVVTTDLPDNVVVVGVPAKIIKHA